MQDNLDGRILNNIFKINRFYRHEFAPDLSVFNLTLIQLHGLMFIGNKKITHNKEIANALQISLPTVTTMIDKLIELDFVKRTDDVEDRRKINLTLTGKGEQVVEKAKRSRCEGFNRIMSKLTQEEKKQLVIITSKLLE